MSLVIFIIFIVIVPLWLVAMGALMIMMFNTFKDERFTLFRLFTGHFIQEPYNRNCLRVFAASVGTGVLFVAAVNALLWMGWITLP